MSESAKLIIEVQAGIIPENPMPEYTKRWVITSKEWDEAHARGMDEPGVIRKDGVANAHGDSLPALLAERVGKAQGYASMFMNSPNIVNWVRTDWIWL